MSKGVVVVPLLVEPVDMKIGVTGPAVCEPVYEVRITVEGEDHRFCGRENPVKINVTKAVRMIVAGLHRHQINDVDHTDAEIGTILA